MTGRERLANRRDSTVLDFESMGLKFTASVSRYPDGRISELFCDNHKGGSAVDLAMHCDGGGWLVLAGSHGWLHGDQRSAFDDAEWLSANFDLPIRAVRP